MVISDFYQKTIFLDTAPLIYYIEGHSTYQDKLNEIFGANDKGEFLFITSTVTLLEALVKPLREGKTKLAEQYKTILTSASGIAIFDVTNEISTKAAELRAKYNLRTPDAIQFATAMQFKADYFLTNDTRLKSLTELQSVILAELE
jgi:predicted nucleic acid-binding protein